MGSLLWRIRHWYGNVTLHPTFTCQQLARATSETLWPDLTDNFVEHKFLQSKKTAQPYTYLKASRTERNQLNWHVEHRRFAPRNFKISGKQETIRFGNFPQSAIFLLAFSLKEHIRSDKSVFLVCLAERVSSQSGEGETAGVPGPVSHTSTDQTVAPRVPVCKVHFTGWIWPTFSRIKTK